ncbi:PREDICTED: acetylcholinesterase-like [Papilio xuthus]|uniref:Carboxylic ester hydrolase n=1 Tax=Papilio xuthus TaxID=66420 RepID=A0AAJ6Z228_PAPXU|nr:PREDICTED: acetylcholinesterase-like [Papilio xuthus]
MKVVVVNLVLLVTVWALPRIDPLVETKLGLIRGLQATDGDYSMFLGIPFAKVNASNPFGPSLPYPEFEDVFEANDDTAICPQREEFDNQIVGTLDCLHLNVYVPNKATSRNKLPVLVWIYGGGFSIGFAGRFVHGPKYLVKQDIILVTLNYRLGPYGFMCLDTPEVPGNQGLKDQLSALRWIKEHIDSFGGDANKITIFGESAGGVSVDYHLISEQEKLFNQVILQSGTAQCPWAVMDSDRNTPTALAKRLGLDTDDVNDALKFLSTVEPDLVIAASLEIPNRFMPCIEKDFDGVEKFIANHPVNSAIPKAKDILILSGYNNQEMLVPYVNRPISTLSLNMFKNNLAIMFDLSNDEDLETIMRQFYVGDEEVSDKIRWDLMNFEADYTFGHPVHRSLSKYLDNGGKVYHYIFSYSGDRNFVKYRNNITIGGASHADEISYLFDVSIFKESPTKEDQLVIDRMTTLWANFAKYGDPTPETTDLLPIKWDPITKDSLPYLNIDNELTLGSRPFHKRTTFLDLFYKTNEHLLKANQRQNK